MLGTKVVDRNEMLVSHIADGFGDNLRKVSEWPEFLWDVYISELVSACARVHACLV
jgi:hypothetical protein